MIFVKTKKNAKELFIPAILKVFLTLAFYILLIVSYCALNICNTALCSFLFTQGHISWFLFSLLLFSFI